jgi:hypothetical protein
MHAPLHSIEPDAHVAAPPLPELLTDPPVLVSFPDPPEPALPLDGAEYAPHAGSATANRTVRDTEKSDPMCVM